MSLVLLEQAHPGMVLAGDIRDKQGRLLLPAGRELTERTIESLRYWGVGSVQVLGEEPPPEPPEVIPPAVLAQARREMDERFRNAGWPHPLLDVLHSMAVTRRARELAGPRRNGT